MMMMIIIIIIPIIVHGILLYDVYAGLKNSPYLPFKRPETRLYGFGSNGSPFSVDLSFPGLAPAQVPYTTAPIRLLTNCT
jgi:hypothetical protein